MNVNNLSRVTLSLLGLLGLSLFFAACTSPKTKSPESTGSKEDQHRRSTKESQRKRDLIEFGRSKHKVVPLKVSEQELARARAIQPIVRKVAKQYGINANLLNAIIMHESRFNARARNRSGAKGLMQLMPKTSRAMAERLGRANRPLDPDFAVHAGAELLSVLLNKFDQNLNMALFGYARGSGRVRSWKKQGGPMPVSVRKFIQSIRRGQHTFSSLGFASS